MPPISKYLCLLFLLTQAVPAWGVIVVRKWPGNLIGISRDARTAWAMNDYICALPLGPKGEDRDPIACGTVVRITKRGLIVHISGSERELMVGDKVEIRKMSTEDYHDTGLLEQEYVHQRSPFSQRNLSVGMNYTLPFLRFDQGVTHSLAVGFMPTYIGLNFSGGNIKGVGYYVTVSYYPSQLFKGLWAMAGAGLCRLTARSAVDIERLSSIGLTGMVGYRLKLSRNFNIGAGLGANYLMNSNPVRFNLQFKGLLPAAFLELGWKF